MSFTTPVGELPLPPLSLRIMKDSDEQFVETGMELTRILYRYGLQDDSSLLDVGCGVGRLPIALLAGTGFHGRYRGFDVMPRHVGWARKNLQPKLEDFTFAHLDVVNGRYNPGGTIAAEDAAFPCRDERFDFACLFSVFTHFYKEDIQRYLRELHRVVRPGGTVIATWFLYDEERLPRVVGESSAHPMVHRLDEVTIYNEETDPLRAIAFDEAYVRRICAEAGFEIERIDRGTWAGEPGPAFQDVVILRRPPLSGPARLRRRARALARRVRDRLRG